MADYEKTVEHNLKGLDGVSTGICPGCQECADTWTDGDLKELEKQWESGGLCDEPSFSWCGCGICGSTFGGDREVWHWLDENNEIMHESDACIDCVMYLANGDVPEDWRHH